MNNDKDLFEAFKAGFNACAYNYFVGPAEDDSLRKDYEAWVQSQTELRPFDFELDLPVRLFNALKRHGAKTVGDVRWWLTMQCDFNEMGDTSECDDGHCHKVIHAYDMKNVGNKMVDQGRDALRRFDERIEQEEKERRERLEGTND